MKMIVLNPKDNMLSNKNPIVPNKDKPLAFLEISGIIIECFQDYFVIQKTIMANNFKSNDKNLVVKFWLDQKKMQQHENKY